MIKGKKSTCHKSCRESLKRGEEVLNLAEEMKIQGSKDEHSRVALVRGLKRLKKYREEEEALKRLLEDVQDKKDQHEDELARFRGLHNLSGNLRKKSGQPCVPKSRK